MGQWYGPDGRRVKRKIVPARKPGSTAGLTKAQAERELRRIRERDALLVATGRVTMQEAGAEHVLRLELKGRKKSHRLTVASDLRIHLVPFFGRKELSRITPEDIEHTGRGRVRDAARTAAAPARLATTYGKRDDLLAVIQSAERERSRGWETDMAAKVDLLKERYQQFSEGDLDNALSNWSSDFTWEGGASEEMPGGGLHEGKEAALKVLQQAVGAWDEFKLTADEFYEDGDTVVVLGHTDVKKGDQSGQLPVVHIWRFRGDEEVCRLQILTDTLQGARMLGRV